MPKYLVSWEIDVDAATPVEAAREARRLQQTNRPDHWVGVFGVIEHDADGTKQMIDLDEIDQETA